MARWHNAVHSVNIYPLKPIEGHLRHAVIPINAVIYSFRAHIQKLFHGNSDIAHLEGLGGAKAPRRPEKFLKIEKFRTLRNFKTSDKIHISLSVEEKISDNNFKRRCKFIGFI